MTTLENLIRLQGRVAHLCLVKFSLIGSSSYEIRVVNEENVHQLILRAFHENTLGTVYQLLSESTALFEEGFQEGDEPNSIKPLDKLMLMSNVQVYRESRRRTEVEVVIEDPNDITQAWNNMTKLIVLQLVLGKGLSKEDTHSVPSIIGGGGGNAAKKSISTLCDELSDSSFIEVNLMSLGSNGIYFPEEVRTRLKLSVSGQRFINYTYSFLNDMGDRFSNIQDSYKEVLLSVLHFIVKVRTELSDKNVHKGLVTSTSRNPHLISEGNGNFQIQFIRALYEINNRICSSDNNMTRAMTAEQMKVNSVAAIISNAMQADFLRDCPVIWSLGTGQKSEAIFSNYKIPPMTDLEVNNIADLLKVLKPPGWNPMSHLAPEFEFTKEKLNRKIRDNNKILKGKFDEWFNIDEVEPETTPMDNLLEEEEEQEEQPIAQMIRRAAPVPVPVPEDIEDLGDQVGLVPENNEGEEENNSENEGSDLYG